MYCISTLHHTDQSTHPVYDFSCVFRSITIVTDIAAKCVGAFEASVRACSAVEMIPPIKHFTSHFYALINEIMVSSGDSCRKVLKLINGFIRP